MFTPRADAPAYVKIRGVREEPLGALSEADARAEGGYTVSEFRDEWRRINGEWTPEQPVVVVSFEGFEEDPRA
jgi:hypothetical protein